MRASACVIGGKRRKRRTEGAVLDVVVTVGFPDEVTSKPRLHKSEVVSQTLSILRKYISDRKQSVQRPKGGGGGAY